MVLRPATAADADLLLAWANDPTTRAAGFRPDRIAPDEHRRWLAERLASPSSRLYVGTADGVPIGQLRLERDLAGAVEVGIAVAPDARGQGLGRQLLEAGLAAGAADVELAPTAFVARIRPDNAASLALFRGAGFADAGRDVVDGLGCLVLRRADPR